MKLHMGNKILFDFYGLITLKTTENLCSLNCTDSQTLLDFVHVLFLFLQQQNCQTCMKCGMGQQPEYCCTVTIALHDNFAPGPAHVGDRTILSPKKVHSDLILEMAEKKAQFREIHHLKGTKQ